MNKKNKVSARGRKFHNFQKKEQQKKKKLEG